jgi:hypothetical protein
MITDISRRHASGLIFAGMIVAAAPAAARTPRARFEQDRRAILAMAGDFHVRFDFRETVSFRGDYDPIDPKVSGGNEVVRVIEDAGEIIRLQHILVIEHDGGTHLVKHWRQDWIYQPREVLAYSGANQWSLQEVARADRRGAWAQTVWQTDDSPRYGGVGQWGHDDGVSRWTSAETMRPLARRDAIRTPPYAWYEGVNRHALTPTGWVHEQDNAKIGLRDGAPATFVHEVVLNTYDRASDFNIATADRYWAATRDYWAAVRAAWDEAIVRGRGVRLQEEADNGSITGPRLMGLADRIQAREIATGAAIAEARTIIGDATGPTRVANRI